MDEFELKIRAINLLSQENLADITKSLAWCQNLYRANLDAYIKNRQNKEGLSKEQVDKNAQWISEDIVFYERMSSSYERLFLQAQMLFKK